MTREFQVPAGRADHVAALERPPDHLIHEIMHFFDVYKDLEPGKTMTTRGSEGPEAAWAEIRASHVRFDESH